MHWRCLSANALTTCRSIAFLCIQVTLNLGAQQNVTDGVSLDSCVIRNSPAAGIWVLGVQPFAPDGVITIRNTTIRNTSDFGLRINKQTAGGMVVHVVNTLLENVAHMGHWPILIQGGGLLFDNVSIKDPLSRAWLEAGWQTPQAVTNVQGTVSVWTPTGQCAANFNVSRGDNVNVHVACHRLPPLHRPHANALPVPSAAQVVPHCTGSDCGAYTIFEAENFSVTSPTSTHLGFDAWTPQSWAHDPNLFASDVSNVFHNRRAYLHASADASQGATASTLLPVPQQGHFHVLVRYEAGYRFNSPFQVTVEQHGGGVVFTKVYGLRSSLRVWGFGGCGSTMEHGLANLATECRRNYGTSENMVWEGVGDMVWLVKGHATVTLTVVAGTGDEYVPITERNVDTVLLTSNTSDLETRLNASSRPLNLDGLIGTQHGEVLAKIESQSDIAMRITLPRTYSRSPLWKGKLVLPVVEHTQTHINQTHVVNTTAVVSGCGYAGVVHMGNASATPLPPGLSRCVTVSLPPRAVSAWVDVGMLLDSQNHAAWNLPLGNYSITLALAGREGPSRGRSWGDSWRPPSSHWRFWSMRPRVRRTASAPARPTSGSCSRPCSGKRSRTPPPPYMCRCLRRRSSVTRPTAVVDHQKDCQIQRTSGHNAHLRTCLGSRPWMCCRSPTVRTGGEHGGDT